MNQDRKKAIDRELRREGLRRWRKWLFVGAGVLLVLGIYTPVFSERVTGEVTGFGEEGAGNAGRIQMRLKLDPDGKIAILVDRDLNRLVGRRVEVSRMTSVAGMASYEFIRYLDPDHPADPAD